MVDKPWHCGITHVLLLAGRGRGLLGSVEDERELVRSADLLVKTLRTSRKESLNYRRWMLVLEKEGELE